MRPFPTCKISVLKTMYNADLDAEYRRDDVHHGPCPLFKEGQEFFVEYIAQRPQGFECDWAWDDIHKILFTFMRNGDFGTWMKNPDNFVTCCTDGVKPVVFKIERLRSEA